MVATRSPADVTLGERMTISALSGMVAATVCHPLDTLRVQMQMDGE
jgi:hypothetical protein